MQVYLEKIINKIKKPGRYINGEWNSIHKDWDKVKVKVVFAFPDVYEVGMSHLGLQILYGIVNKRMDALMERVFAPWADMEEEMRRNGLSLFSLESRRLLKEFDIIAFTLQYELTFTNIINMLNLGEIPLKAAERDDQYPLVIGGGPCAFNPEPLAEFFDAFIIGEGEEVIHEFLDLYVRAKKEGLAKRDFLHQATGIAGVYIPSFYEVSYDDDGSVLAVSPVVENAPLPVTKRVVRDLNKAYFPVKPVVPYLEVVHDRAMLEVFRGCTRGCRFCQAGFIYRPVREKFPESLLQQAKALLSNTGYNEISLTSLSTGDYSQINLLVSRLLDCYKKHEVNISLPSLRVDSFSVELANKIQQVRRSTLTFAPEAGSQRLRDVINKKVTASDLMEAVSAAFKAGWQNIKLYFMIGLPTETLEDLKEIAMLAKAVVDLGEKLGVPRNRLKVTVSASSFVPKSHTPFQWEPQFSLEELKEKQTYLKKLLKDHRISFRWQEAEMSFLEAVLARGDRRLGKVLELAGRSGCRFDSWSECFNFKLWQEVFKEAALNPEWYAYRRYQYQDILPWDHIDSGVRKGYLIKEHEKAMAGFPTPDCRMDECSGCGLCQTLETNPEVVGR